MFLRDKHGNVKWIAKELHDKILAEEKSLAAKEGQKKLATIKAQAKK